MFHAWNGVHLRRFVQRLADLGHDSGQETGYVGGGQEGREVAVEFFTDDPANFAIKLELEGTKVES